MSRQKLAVLGVSALLSTALACSKSDAPLTPTTPTGGTVVTGPAGETLKVTAPSAVSPTGGTKQTSATMVFTASPVAFTNPVAGAPAPQYRFQVLNSANAVVREVLLNNPTWTIADVFAVGLLGNTAYSWQVRGESAGQAGPWSSKAAFITVDPFVINDPLTNGRTVGNRIGGHFVPGQGWQSDSVSDGIDYDLATPCTDCRLEFDATNFGGQEGFPYEKDLKWVSMGDAGGFGNFSAFRDQPWKMHLVQRADFASGVEIVWRNGGTDPNGGDPGDHRIKLNSTPLVFTSTKVYHFQLDWGPRGYNINIDGLDVMADGWGRSYAPPNMRIELGCIPRGDSFVGIVYRNVILKKH